MREAVRAWPPGPQRGMRRGQLGAQGVGCAAPSRAGALPGTAADAGDWPRFPEYVVSWTEPSAGLRWYLSWSGRTGQSEDWLAKPLPGNL